MGEQETAREQVLEAERPGEAAAPESASASGTADVEQLILDSTEARPQESDEARDLAVLEAIVYVTDEPLPVAQIASALGRPPEQIQALLDRLVAEYNKPEHGLSLREVAGGYKMATKPEHHEAVRQFVRNLNPPLKLSLAALETLAVIAYKQPITAPEIMEIRGVQGAGVLKTLLDRKLITTSGRKNVVGRPILYKTTKEFLVQFGLKDLSELPTLKEFEELRRLGLGEDEPVLGAGPAGAAVVENPDVARQPDDPDAPPAPPPEPEQPAHRSPGPESPGRHEPEPEIPDSDPDEHG
ncbi:MAG TPA: SMC-Scp complex subunit ScpB [Bryobacteraceae bacterium]|nr:SMC-Scp complex subunit ScpB [Bryobacteraceae bacterium]